MSELLPPTLAEVLATVPNASDDECLALNKRMTLFPNVVSRVMEWMFNNYGKMTPEFRAAITGIPYVPGASVAPTGLAAEGKAGYIQLKWLPVYGARGYAVYRSPSLTGTKTRIDNQHYLATGLVTMPVYAPEYSDTTALINTDYFYWVRTLTTEGLSEYSGTATARWTATGDFRLVRYLTEDEATNGIPLAGTKLTLCGWGGGGAGQGSIKAASGEWGATTKGGTGGRGGELVELVNYNLGGTGKRLFVKWLPLGGNPFVAQDFLPPGTATESVNQQGGGWSLTLKLGTTAANAEVLAMAGGGHPGGLRNEAGYGTASMNGSALYGGDEGSDGTATENGKGGFTQPGKAITCNEDGLFGKGGNGAAPVAETAAANELHYGEDGCNGAIVFKVTT